MYNIYDQNNEPANNYTFFDDKKIESSNKNLQKYKKIMLMKTSNKKIYTYIYM